MQEVDPSKLNMTNMVAKNLTEVRTPFSPDIHSESQDYFSIEPNDFLVPGNYSKLEPDEKAFRVLKKIKSALEQKNGTKS